MSISTTVGSVLFRRTQIEGEIKQTVQTAILYYRSPYHFPRNITYLDTTVSALPDPPTLPRSIFKILPEFATEKSHFIFNGQYYDQIDGVAMGSPLGPVLANIFNFCAILKRNGSLTTALALLFDDTFILFDNKNTATQFLHYLNDCHANIKFSVEFEESSTIPFLDIPIKRHNHTFSTSIYRKKTFTGLYTKWDSFTPRKYKVNLIRTLSFRSLFPHLFVTFSFAILSVNELIKLLLQNGYPAGVVNYNINDVLNRQQNRPKNPTTTVPKKETF